jgi:hypothetical protein
VNDTGLQWYTNQSGHSPVWFSWPDAFKRSGWLCRSSSTDHSLLTATLLTTHAITRAVETYPTYSCLWVTCSSYTIGTNTIPTPSHLNPSYPLTPPTQSLHTPTLATYRKGSSIGNKPKTGDSIPRIDCLVAGSSVFRCQSPISARRPYN